MNMAVRRDTRGLLVGMVTMTIVKCSRSSSISSTLRSRWIELPSSSSIR